MRIKLVRDFWDENPVHSIEIPIENNLKAFSDKCDALRWNNYNSFKKFNLYDVLNGKGKKILDAGCGTGVCTRYYARKGLDVFAIDISIKSIQITQKTLELNNLKCYSQQASVEDIPFKSNYFDYIVSYGVIHHTPNTEKAVDEFFRVLRPGGMAFVSVNFKNIFLKFSLWYLTRKLIPIAIKRSAGRESLDFIKSPEDLSCVYDGNNCPISKLYTRKQADKLFSKFEILHVEPHYFPVRFLRFYKIKSGTFLHDIVDKYLGTAIYYILKKPL